jgi:tetratricopeptide (TPR) repeat protein
LHSQGKLKEAESTLKKAATLKPNSADVLTAYGSLLCDLRKFTDAEALLQKAIVIRPSFADAHYNLGVLLQGNGKEADAETQYRQAIDLRPYPEAHVNLAALIRKQKGKLPDAEAHCRKAIEINPRFVNAQAMLGILLVEQNRFAEGVLQLKKAVELFPDGDLRKSGFKQLIKSLEEAAQSEKKLNAILKGEAQPTEVELLPLALLCQQNKKLNWKAVSFYDRAFAAQPKSAEDMSFHHRYNAACAAALAGIGKGEDDPKPDDKEGAELRKKALDWLRADLAAWSKLLDDNKPKIQEAILQTIGHWKDDPDLAGIRDKDALTKLPIAEQEVFRKLWSDVDDLLKRAQIAKK